jgi:putative methionine-R-sulfoxide reductase with GAF domain
VPDLDPALKRLREILSIHGDRVGKAKRISAAIRETGGFRWVGIYDVSAGEIGVVAWSGPPRDPRRRITPGMTRHEIVVPVLDATSGQVVGLLGVESGIPDALGEEDRRSLEQCAALLTPLWR